MPDTIGTITVPAISPSGTFPLTTDWGHTQTIAPAVAMHRFISGNTKIEQRFLLGRGARRWTGRWARLSEDELADLKDFFESRRGPYEPFTLNVPADDGQTFESVTVRFENAPLSWNQLIESAVETGLGFVEEIDPDDAPAYEVDDTGDRFPSEALEAALESQVQSLVPLIVIKPKKTGYPTIYLSDRRCTVGGQLYQARLLTWSGISQTLSGGPGDQSGQTDTASFTFGNADKVMRDLAASVDLFRAEISFSLYHVGQAFLLNLWKGEIVDYSISGSAEVQLAAVDGLYDTTLQYPFSKIGGTCVKRYDDGEGCPFSSTGGGHTAGALDLVNFPSADAGSCDHGYLTPNGCKAHTMKRFFGAVIATPQSVRVKDNSAGFFGTGRPTFTATSLVSDSMMGQPLVEIFTDVPMPVNGLIVAGRDEGDFYEALAIVGAGPLSAYARGQYDAAGNAIFHTLDGQPHHGYPGSLGLREVLGSDPAEATDFLSLDQSGNQTGGDPDKAFSGASTYLDHFSAGVAFIVLRRTDQKGLQLTTLDQHTFQAWVAQGLSGWIWTAPGARSRGLLINPIWIQVNVFLNGTGRRYATIEEAEAVLDIPACVAAAAICNITVDKLIGAGTETQFKFQGVLRDTKVLRDWIQEIGNNALGCWLFSNGKFKPLIREDAAAEASFSGGNMVYQSLRLAPIRPAFNRLTVSFANADYNFILDTLPVQDDDHIGYLGRILDSTLNLSGAAGKSMAGRIGATRLKEELGGVGEDEQLAAREATWKTTVLALSVEPGKGVSVSDPDVPSGIGLFRVTKWVLNPDMSIDMFGRTITDSMYDVVAGPKMPDVPANPVPVEFFPYPLRSEWFPNREAPPAGDPIFEQTDITFGLEISYEAKRDRGQLVRAIVSGDLAVNEFLEDTEGPIIRAQSDATTGGQLAGRTNYWAQVFVRDANGRWSPGSNIRHFSFEDVATDDNELTLSNITWPAGDWVKWVLFVGDDEKTICAQNDGAGTTEPPDPFEGRLYLTGVGTLAAVDSRAPHAGPYSSSAVLGCNDQMLSALVAFKNVGDFIQAAGATFPEGSYPSFSKAWDSDVTAGKLLLVVLEFSIFPAASTTVTDSQGNAYTQIILHHVGGSGLFIAIFAATAGATGPNEATAHFSGFGLEADNGCMGVLEYDASGWEVDVQTWGENIGGGLIDLSVTTTGEDEMVFSLTGIKTLCPGSPVMDGPTPPSFPSEITFAGPLKQGTYNAPSPAHRFVRTKVKRLIHGGVIGAVVTDVDSGTGDIVFGGLAGLSDDWTGRLIYWAADFSDDSAPAAHFRITAYDISTGAATLSPDPIALGVATGDLFYFRLEPNIFSSDGKTIGDVMVQNDVYPSGADIDGEIGYLIRGVTPGRPHQIRRVVSNDHNSWDVDKAFDYQPTYFCVETSDWTNFGESASIDVPTTGVRAAIAAEVANLEAQPITVGAFLVDRLGNETPEAFAQIRDGYIFGAKARSVLTTKGDILVYSAAEQDEARLAVGATGEVLTVDPGDPTGLSWQTAPGGGTAAAAQKFSDSWSGVASKTVTHGLGTTAVLVQVFDSASGLKVDPQSVVITDANTVDLTFGANFDGRAVIIAFSSSAAPALNYSQSWSAQTSVVLAHNLGSSAVIVQVRDSATGQLVTPQGIEITSANSVTLTFGAAFTGSAIVARASQTVRQYSASWVGQTSIAVTHNLGTSDVIVQVYDAAGKQVEAQGVTITDANTVTLEFGAAFDGSVVVMG